MWRTLLTYHIATYTYIRRIRKIICCRHRIRPGTYTSLNTSTYGVAAGAKRAGGDEAHGAAKRAKGPDGEPKKEEPDGEAKPAVAKPVVVVPVVQKGMPVKLAAPTGVAQLPTP